MDVYDTQEQLLPIAAEYDLTGQICPAIAPINPVFVGVRIFLFYHSALNAS